MFDRFRQRTEETKELDLLPFMNLFIVLIPLLLSGAVFYRIGVIPSSVAAHTPDDPGDERNTDEVTVHLVLARSEMALSVSNSSIEPAELAQWNATWPVRDAKWDLNALQDHLYAIKSKYPESRNLILLPHEEVDFESLVTVLDAAREKDMGKNDRGQETRAELFPGVVMSRFVPKKHSQVPGQASEGEEVL